jgi:hypothetical protein
MASIGRLGEQQRTGALSEPRKLEIWVTGRYEQSSPQREEI